MSYGPPHGNQYGAPPPQGHGYPPQGPPHPQQGWGAPPGQHFNQGYNQGPPSQGYGQHQQYNQGPYQQPPPPQHGYPPNQQWGQQQQQWGPPPPQQYGHQPHSQGPPAPPSPGYDPHVAAHGDASRDADALRSAMKGFGTNEVTLIQILSKPDPLQMALLRNTYRQRHNRDLEKDIHSETSKYFRDGLEALVRGPLAQDCYLVNSAIKGIGTKESLLNDVLLGRRNADMRAIKQAYQQTYKHTLEADVGNDLSLKTKQLFSMVMAATRAEDSAPVNPQQVDMDVDDLHRATTARTVGADQITVCQIISSRSDGQLRAISHAFQQKYHKSLREILDRKFDGHMEESLLLMIDRACDRAMTDAVQLEDSMKGAGTKDVLMINRIVRIHWDRAHMDQVKRAYQHRYKRDLIGRVKGEIHTNRDYENLMVSCLT